MQRWTEAFMALLSGGTSVELSETPVWARDRSTPADILLRKAGITEQTAVKYLVDEGIFAVATPEVAAKMANDAAILELARAVTNRNGESRLVGWYIIWIQDRFDERGEIFEIADNNAYFGDDHRRRCAQPHHLLGTHTIIVAPTKEEAETRLRILTGSD